MTILLQPAYVDRLIKILGRLGSSFEGERLAAVEAANRLLKEHNLTWHDVIGGGGHHDMEGSRARSTKTKWRDTINGKISEALQCTQILNAWELGFCKSLLGRTKLTARQQICLDKISAKVTAFNAARKAA